MLDLTPRQEEILQLIRERIAVTGRPPTRAEIAEILGFRSANAAEQHLRALERKGVIELKAGASRGIRLLQEGPPDNLGLPIIGRVAAGQPMLAAPHIEDYWPLQPELFKPRADYLLRVRGMSMRDAGIMDGDLLVVHGAEEARNGQIVVARVGEEEVTVKRFYRHGEQIELVPENPEYPVLRFNSAERALSIEGLVVGVIRRFD